MSKSINRRSPSQNDPQRAAYFPEKLRQELSEDLQLSGMSKRTTMATSVPSGSFLTLQSRPQT